MTHLTQAARILAAHTGDRICDAEAAIVLVCERCGCDVEEASRLLCDNVNRDGWRAIAANKDTP